MSIFTRSVFSLLTLVTLAFPTQGRQSAQNTKLPKVRGGVVAGRVTLDGEPAKGLRVILESEDAGASPFNRRPGLYGMTDEGGRFRLTDVPPGTYTLTAAASAAVPPGEGRGGTPGKLLVVKEGEELRDVDLSLKQGGVITGVVTDANGQPVIGERVQAWAVNERGERRRVIPNNPSGETDDRGMYRLYGLPEGRYLVGLRPRATPGGRRAAAALDEGTYHPDATDASRAEAVAVRAGGEVENINITLGRRAEVYSVAGRVVDAETGEPVPDAALSYRKAAGGDLRGAGQAARTDRGGEFRLEQVKPGRYVAFIIAEPGRDTYGDAVPFEVADGDVRGLEVKVRRGSSISGVAVIEGPKNPAALNQLSNVSVVATVPGGGAVGFAARAPLAPDGSFRLTGVRPGRALLTVASYPSKEFSLLRVERDGVAQPRGIEVGTGESISGVRLVLTYGRGSVRGEVKVNGALPAGARIRASLQREQAASVVGSAEVDAQGRFVIPDVPPGDYTLVVRAVAPPNGESPPANLPSARQPLSVTSGSVTEATVVLNLAREQ